MNAKPLRILVIGASSSIAQAVARLYAGKQAQFFLVGRNAEKVAIVGKDLRVRGASKIGTLTLDLSKDFDAGQVVEAALEVLHEIDLVFMAHGILPNQQHCQLDAGAFAHAWQVNFLSTAKLMHAVVPQLEKQKHGVLAVITSVAGDRGRPSNYVYGAAKAALSVMLEGVRGRCFLAGVHVIDIKPGFVDTQMTADLPKNFLFASPQKVAFKIVHAITRRRHQVYVPGFWWAIMSLIKAIPAGIFKRLNL